MGRKRRRRPATPETPRWYEPATVAVVSLGCAKNLTISEEIAARFGMSGYVLTPSTSGAELVVVNTCGFIEPARRETRERISELVELKKKGLVGSIVVYGCMVQGFHEELRAEFPDVDLWVGSTSSDCLFSLVRKGTCGTWLDTEWRRPGGKVLPRLYQTPPSFAYLKVSEGCDNRCAYCSIPRLRGPLRSLPTSAVLKEAVEIAESGRREAVLVAQDLTAWGTDRGRRELPGLVEKMAMIEGLEWIRLLYMHPAGITDEIVEMFRSNPKVTPYADVPLQHLDDGVLRSMGRPYDYARVLALTAALREARPDMTIRTSIIVGYPTEGEAEFARLLDRLDELDLDRVGVFTYSPERETAAWKLGDPVPEEEKERRRRAVMELCEAKAEAHNAARVGEETTLIVDTLAEDEDGPYCICRSPREAPEVDGVVYLDGEGEPGGMVRAVITGSDVHDLYAERLPEAGGEARKD